VEIALTETPSELYQLEVICENALIYPEVDARKATLRRSQILDLMLEFNKLAASVLPTQPQAATGGRQCRDCN